MNLKNVDKNYPHTLLLTQMFLYECYCDSIVEIDISDLINLVTYKKKKIIQVQHKNMKCKARKP